VPGDSMAGVGGHAAHDGDEGAFGHIVAIVDGAAVADGGKQLVVLGLVEVVLFAFVAPDAGVALDEHAAAALAEVGEAFGAIDVAAHVADAAGHLAAVADELGFVGVFIDDGKMVVDVAVFGARADLPPAEADGFGGIFALE